MVWTATRVEHWQRTGQRPAVAVWTAAQTAQFLHTITGHRLYAAYHLIALRGLRRGEASRPALALCQREPESGLGVILLASEPEQFVQHCDRVIALSDGRGGEVHRPGHAIL